MNEFVSTFNVNIMNYKCECIYFLNECYKYCITVLYFKVHSKPSICLHRRMNPRAFNL